MLNKQSEVTNWMNKKRDMDISFKKSPSFAHHVNKWITHKSGIFKILGQAQRSKRRKAQETNAQAFPHADDQNIFLMTFSDANTNLKEKCLDTNSFYSNLSKVSNNDLV